MAQVVELLGDEDTAADLRYDVGLGSNIYLNIILCLNLTPLEDSTFPNNKLLILSMVIQRRAPYLSHEEFKNKYLGSRLI